MVGSQRGSSDLAWRGGAASSRWMSLELTASRYDLRFSGVLSPLEAGSRSTEAASSVWTDGDEVTEGENFIGEVGGVPT